MQAMKRLLIVLFLTLAATGCQGGLFRRPTSNCASTGAVYESMPCEDGGAYLGSPQMLPGP